MEMLKSTKEELLKYYGEKEPSPFIRFTVGFSEDYRGYDVECNATYELMNSGRSVRVLITPEASRDKVIGSLLKVIHWILTDDILKCASEELKRDKESKGKSDEIKNKLKEAGYSDEDILNFCKTLIDTSDSFLNTVVDLNPF